MAVIADSILKIPSSKESGLFFYLWVLFLQPIHKLSGREILLLAALLKARYNLTKVISDDNMIDEVLLSPKTRELIREELNINMSYFNVLLNLIKNKKILINNRIDKRYIPSIDDSGKGFKLLFFFEFEDVTTLGNS